MNLISFINALSEADGDEALDLVEKLQSGQVDCSLLDTAVEAIRVAKRKHDHTVSQLQVMLEHRDAPIQLGEDASAVIKADHPAHKGVMAGVQLALSIIGDFPVEVSE